MLPTFTDKDAALDAFARWCGNSSGRADDAIGKRYFSYWTNHYLWHDTGIALVLAATSIASLSKVLVLNRIAALSWVRTPVHRWTYVLIGAGVMVGAWASGIGAIITDARRDTFPPCADSIGIPIMGLTAFTMVATPFLAAVGFVITRGFGQLPVPLWRWDSARVLRSWLISVIAAGLIFFVVIAGVEMALGSSAVAMPFVVAAIHLLASTRAHCLLPK